MKCELARVLLTLQRSWNVTAPHTKQNRFRALLTRHRYKKPIALAALAQDVFMCWNHPVIIASKVDIGQEEGILKDGGCNRLATYRQSLT